MLGVKLSLLAVLALALGDPGKTTRYWDCCKPSCAWPGKNEEGSLAKTCAKDGVTKVDPNEKNSCDGGNAYVCNSHQPWVEGDVAYGFAAASIPGKREQQWCCACYELKFTSGPVSGKKMIVQVTNTGSDLGGGHFDLQIPGGGLGIFNGCTPQWNAPWDGWGQRYGGISSQSQCSQLPQQLQSGCNFRFGWFKNADNPTMDYRQVTCPKSLVEKSGCNHSVPGGSAPAPSSGGSGGSCGGVSITSQGFDGGNKCNAYRVKVKNNGSRMKPKFVVEGASGINAWNAWQEGSKWVLNWDLENGASSEFGFTVPGCNANPNVKLSC